MRKESIISLLSTLTAHIIYYATTSTVQWTKDGSICNTVRTEYALKREESGSEQPLGFIAVLTGINKKVSRKRFLLKSAQASTKQNLVNKTKKNSL